jgi:hypothetical protein
MQLPIVVIPSLGLSPVSLDLENSRNFSSLGIHIPMSSQAVPELSTSHFDYSTAFEMVDWPSMTTRLLRRRGIVWAEMMPSYGAGDVLTQYLNVQNKSDQKVVKEIGM